MIYCYPWKAKPYFVLRKTITENVSWSRTIVTDREDQDDSQLNEGEPFAYEDALGQWYYTVPNISNGLVTGGTTFPAISAEHAKRVVDAYLNSLGIKIAADNLSCFE